jgi:trimethylamine--corrinoid protein Co-methyltransferase
LVDALDFDFVTSIYPDPDEVPVKIRDIQIASIAFQNTTKPFVIGPYNENSLKYMIEMGLAIRGSKEKFKMRPSFSILIASISPLQLPKNQVEMILMGCKTGVPLELMPMPMAGISAPATIPGVVIISGVEALTMNVIAQLIAPDTPVIFSPRTTYLDMAVGVYAVGLEYGMISAVQAQMAREKYGMPSNVFGPHTTSAVNDNQAMIESVLCSIFPVFSGATIVGGAGSIEGGVTADPAHVVIADELLKMEIKAMQGVNVTEETIGLDVIRQVGIGRDYLSTDHTLKFFRSQFYRCPLFDLRYRDSWKEDGSKDMNMRARERVLSILKEHKPNPLDEPILKDIKSIVKSAEHELT